MSIWLDDLSRERLTTGNLHELITDKHVVGVTTNPTIFAGALSERRGLRRAGPRAGRARRVASTTRSARSPSPTCATPATCSAAPGRRTGGVDGRVSIEVDPRLAHDTEKTVAQALDLWKAVDRPNLLVKIPATEAGPAGDHPHARRGRQRERHADLLGGALPRGDGRLHRRPRAGQRPTATTLAGIHSVASFFVSRVDTEIDKRLEEIGTDEALALRGKAGVANARLAYAAFQEAFAGRRAGTALAGAGRARRSVRCGRRPG